MRNDGVRKRQGGLDDREKGQLGWIVSKNGEAAAAVRMG